MKLNEKQQALLDELGLPYSSDTEYTVELLGELEDVISDHALYYEQCDDGMTEKGDDLLDLVSFFARNSYRVDDAAPVQKMLAQ